MHLFPRRPRRLRPERITVPLLEAKNILVTGGAGFIGSHLVDRLISERPARLVVIDNFFLGKERNLKDARERFPELRIYRDDVTRPERLAAIIRENGVDLVFHLAVIPLPASLERPKWSFSQNVQMSLVLCELMRRGHFRTLVHFSSSEVYGTAVENVINEDHPLEPLTPYAASKAACDHLVLSYARTFGMEMTIIRPFNTYGPRQNENRYAGIIPLTIQRILGNTPPLVYGDGQQTRDFLYVADTVDAAVRLVKAERARGQIVQIGSGVETRILDVIGIMRGYLGGGPEIRFAAARPGDVRRHRADISRLKSLVEFEPRYPLKEGLARTVDWYRRHLASGP